MGTAGTIAEKTMCSEGLPGGKRMYTCNHRRAKKLIPAFITLDACLGVPHLGLWGRIQQRAGTPQPCPRAARLARFSHHTVGWVWRAWEFEFSGRAEQVGSLVWGFVACAQASGPGWSAGGGASGHTSPSGFGERFSWRVVFSASQGYRLELRVDLPEQFLVRIAARP